LGDVAGLILSNLKFERRYFQVRKDVMYFYKSKSSETSLGSYKLKEVVECAAVENDPVTFFIKIQTKEDGIKRLCFIADTQDRRDHWVEGINHARTVDENAMLEVYASEINFFKDIKPLFIEIEEQPNIKFEPLSGFRKKKLWPLVHNLERQRLWTAERVLCQKQEPQWFQNGILIKKTLWMMTMWIQKCLEQDALPSSVDFSVQAKRIKAINMLRKTFFKGFFLGKEKFKSFIAE